MTELTREIRFEPAFDKRSLDPAKNYGIHGVTMRWLVKGPLGAVQFVVFTNWQLPHVTEETLQQEWGGEDRIGLKVRFLPMPADLGYHSPTPQYEGQTPMGNECAIIKGTCYYDGSMLNAELVFDLLVREGGDAVWARLEEYYRQTFPSPYAAHKGASPELDSPSQSLDRIDRILAESKAEEAHAREVEDTCPSCGARTFSGICSAKCERE